MAPIGTSARSSRVGSMGPVGTALLVVGVGLALGVVTLLGQAVLPGGWNRLANSGAIWLLFAFLVGAGMASDRSSMLAGFGVLVGALVGYYAAATVAGSGGSAAILAIWTGTALVGGPVYGLAGRWWRVRTGPWRAVAIGLLGGIFAAEGVSTLLRIPDLAAVGWVEIVVGIAIVLVLGRTGRERLQALAVLPVIVLLGVAAYEVIDRVIAAR